MKKKVIIIIAVVLVAILVLAGCESYKNATIERVDTDKPVESNGGSVVKQGNYLYFVNGYADYQSKTQDNWFGNVLKGAIMRICIDDLSDMNKAEIVVPKSVMSSAENTGFSIYGDYIYYVSPSTTESRSGTVQNSDLQFMRTRLDGQKTQVILEIKDGKSTQYKYTDKGLTYVKDGNLYFKSTDAKRFKKSKDGDLIAEEVTAFMPVNKYYDGKTTTDDVVFYTKASTATYDSTNTLYAYVPGTKADDVITVIDKNTFVAGKSEDMLYKNMFSVSILGAATEANGNVTLAYTKTYYSSNSTSGTAAGTFMYSFDATYAFDPAKERQISGEALSSVTVIGWEEGVLSTSSTMTKYAYDKDTKKAALPVEFKDDNGSISSSAAIVSVQGNYVYYVLSNQLYSYKIDKPYSYVNVMGNSATVKTDFIRPEFITLNGKLNVFYFDKDNEYLYRYEFNDVKSQKDVTPSLVGRKKDADVTAEEE